MPHVTQTQTAEALREVRKSATDGNTRGFMLAFTGGGRFGFSFLVRNVDFSTALYCVRNGHSWPEYTCVFQGGADSDDSFVEEYLRTAAENMQADYGELITHFAKRNSGWRFEPWEGGAPGRSRDNYLVWRTHLWPLALRIAFAPPRCLDAIRPDVRTIVLGYLRGHATEGLIVLDK